MSGEDTGVEHHFALTKVRLRQAWAAAMFSSLARAVLEFIVVDTWEHPAARPGYTSRFCRGFIVGLFEKAEAATGRGVRRAIKSLLAAGTITIENDKLVVNAAFPSLLTESQRKLFDVAQRVHGSRLGAAVAPATFGANGTKVEDKPPATFGANGTKVPENGTKVEPDGWASAELDAILKRFQAASGQ
ncbi:MAG: hypothetical protein IT461_04460 [Planctomycetes bacterium]|nr:hypothetical protein [Planctomycetota bacterium]